MVGKHTRKSTIFKLKFMKEILAEILEYLKSTRPTHFDFDPDNWYSCSMSEGGTSDDSKEGKCTCNFQEKSEKLEALILKVQNEIDNLVEIDFSLFASEEMTKEMSEALDKAKRASSTTYPTIPGMR